MTHKPHLKLLIAICFCCLIIGKVDAQLFTSDFSGVIPTPNATSISGISWNSDPNINGLPTTISGLETPGAIHPDSHGFIGFQQPHQTPNDYVISFNVALQHCIDNLSVNGVSLTYDYFEGGNLLLEDNITVQAQFAVNVNGVSGTAAGGANTNGRTAGGTQTTVIPLITTLTDGSHTLEITVSQAVGFTRFGFSEIQLLGSPIDDTTSPGCTTSTPTPTPTPIPVPQFINIIDTSAINQLVGSGIPMNMTIGQIASNIHNVGGRSLNQRIHRLRGRHTHEFLRENRIRRGREVSAARHFQAERDLKITNTINLTGRTEASIPSVNASGLHFDSVTFNDNAEWIMPSVTQHALYSSDPRVVAAGNNWEVFALADFGQYDLDALGGSPGVESNTYAATAGIEYVINENWAVGAGWSHVWNDNTLAGGVGNVDIEGDTAMFYTSYFKDNLWADVFYSYGDYEADIKRNAFGSTMRAAPDIEAHQTTLNLGYNIPVEDRFVHGPTFRADYSWGTLDGYTETGNAAFNTRFREQDYESFITTLGWQLNWRTATTFGATMRPTLRVGYGRENLDQERNVSGTLQQSPFARVNAATNAIVDRGATVTNSLSQVDPGEGWMEFGAGVGFDFHKNFGLFFDYQGRFFQEDAQLHLGTVKASWRW